ncbi:D-alanyl-D-alanine carboxypeptidase, partial [Streptomyces sp. NPDC051287]
MEEASVAGESPDRSKQRESSAEPTSGSAGTVPEPRDPRLAVAAEDGKETAGGVDTATRVFSVRDVKPDGEDDTELRQAVAAWVRTGTPATEGEASDADTEKPERPEAATEPGEGPEGAAEPQDAPGAPEKAGEAATAAETTNDAEADVESVTADADADAESVTADAESVTADAESVTADAESVTADAESVTADAESVT